MRQDTLKHLRAIQRELRISSGSRSLETQTIPSRKDKQSDPRKQRKSKDWMKDVDTE